MNAALPNPANPPIKETKVEIKVNQGKSGKSRSIKVNQGQSSSGKPDQINDIKVLT